MPISEQLEFKINEEWERFARENPWASFIPEFARDTEGQEYMKGRGRSVIYRIRTEREQTCECTNCKGKIVSKTVAHAIWDGPFPMSGSGRCHYENVPYCPQCEKEPPFHGSPIQVR
ncbi:hypothetical protein HYZ97_04800 [Candidatus Pacearchaeota archaeon]|nr:hypothetical protein [Candidatus Pacearchaeota archaeon]